MPERNITDKGTKSLTRTEYAVLGLLAHTGRETSGYDLKKIAARSVGYLWAPSQSQLYAVLRRLVEAGLATRREVEQRARPDKQLYRTTAAGRAELREWLARDESGSDPDASPFLLKLFFGAQGDRDALLRQLEAFRVAFTERLELYEAKARLPGDAPSDEFTFLTLRYGIVRARAAVEWADAALAELRGLSSQARRERRP